VALELSTYTINMWAILNKDNTVIGVFPPDVSEEERLKESCGKTLIEMTLENSPGWIGAKYINGKFV
jgi:hypothetical protein